MSRENKGKELLSEVILATGLPREALQKEINTLATKHGVATDQITLEDLRLILADYMQEVLIKAKDAYSA